MLVSGKSDWGWRLYSGFMFFGSTSGILHFFAVAQQVKHAFRFEKWS